MALPTHLIKAELCSLETPRKESVGHTSAEGEAELAGAPSALALLKALPLRPLRPQS